MRCYQCNLHTATIYLFTLIRVISCFRSEEAEGKRTGETAFARAAENLVEGNENALMRQTEFKRSLKEDDSYSAPRMVSENYLTNDLMAISSKPKYREKRSKHSKGSTKKSSIENSDSSEQPESTKDQLMNILGTIQTAKHHRLSRKDIRKLARKAFAKLKLKKKDSKSSKKTTLEKQRKTTKDNEKGADSKDKAEQPKNQELKKPKEDNNAQAQIDKAEIKADKSLTNKEDKSRTEDEKAFASMFDDSAKTKMSELSEDITTLQSNKKVSDVITDDKMSKKSTKLGSNVEALFEGKSAPTEAPTTTKTTAKMIEQELNKEFSTNEKSNPDLADKPKETKAPKKSEIKLSKKSDIPDTNRLEKIKTLRTLLAKASKSKVPKKFLGKFPAGLRMIAWRELLEKKKKELAEFESSQEDEKTTKKEVTVAQDTHPVTIDINIDPSNEKATKVSAKKDIGPAVGIKTNKQADSHHLATHVKYLQKHLSGVQDLRKLISRALIGHCHATGKRILKAFIAMDRALTRAQKIATVIGKKFKVDATKIENIVVHKEDEVVESFLRDIFANFN